MEWLIWILFPAALAVGAYSWIVEQTSFARDRAALDDHSRQQERAQLVLTLYSLTLGSLKRSVGFQRLLQELSWKRLQLEEVLAFGVGAGWIRPVGEPAGGSFGSTRLALTAEGATYAEWLRDGAPESTGANVSYNQIFAGPVCGSNVANGNLGDVNQVAGEGRLDFTVTVELVDAVRRELGSGGLPDPRHKEARRILDSIEQAASEPAVKRAVLRGLCRELHDVCVGVAGNGLWVAVVALVAHVA